VYVTQASERQAISLGDGTVVRLAPQSRLQVLDVPGAREVWLEGRAFFAVAKQPGRPFKVRARSGLATVLGTQFELRAQDQRLDLIVAEGRVALSGATRAVNVGAAQRSSVINGEPTVAEPVADVDSALSWMGTFLVFDAATLEGAALELTRVYGVRVELLPGAPVKRLVTGWFSDQSLVEVVSAICLVVKASCSVADSVVTIGR
jgi:transmembrane sensor